MMTEERIQQFKLDYQSNKFDTLVLTYDFPYYDSGLAVYDGDITYPNFGRFGNHDVVYKFDDRNFIFAILPMRSLNKFDSSVILDKINKVLDDFEFLQLVLDRGY